MASPVGHSLMGVVIYLATVTSSEWLRRWGWLFLIVLFSAAADLDYLHAVFGRLDLANAYHRGLSHTVLFAIGATVLYLIIAGAWTRKLMWKPALVLLVACCIHLLIDVFTEDNKAPYGIAPFRPFGEVLLYSSRPIFPAIEKATYSDLLSLRNVKAALFETVFFGIMAFIVGAVRLFIERYWRQNV